MTFAEKLKALRGRAGLTQTDLAEKAGLAKQTVSHLEAGIRRPGLSTAQRLARALNVPLAEFDPPADVDSRLPAG
jgi:transcriptional regulator with XRE-family HTH domain